MQFGIRFTLPDEEEETDFFEAPNIAAAHDAVNEKACEGLILAWNILVRQAIPPRTALEICHSNLHGDTIPYTLLIEGGGEEPGIADVSGEACGKMYRKMWTEEQREIAREHVGCTNGDCPVLQLIEIFHLQDLVASDE